MRVACALIPRFALAVELIERPELRGRQVVLGGAAEDRKTVVDCSPEAEREGVRPGMPLREARGYCRHAIFIEARPARYRERHERMLTALEAFSPLVEEAEPGCAYVGLDGLTATALRGHTGVRPLFNDERALAGAMIDTVATELHLYPRVGIADGRFVARAAAEAASTSSMRAIEPGGAAAFLAPLPVHALPFGENDLHRLRWLGLRTVGDLSALPREAIAAQFGPTGERAWDLAQGIDRIPLQPRRQPPTLSSELTFEQPVADTRAVLAAARHLLVRLLHHPERADRVARGLTLSVELCDGQHWVRTLTFREPTADHPRMLRAIAAKLDSAEFSAPAEKLTLMLRDLCGEAGTQSSLFSGRGRQLRDLYNALEQLRSHLGHGSIMRIVGVEPWSRLPERRYALIEYEPAVESSR